MTARRRSAALFAVVCLLVACTGGGSTSGSGTTEERFGAGFKRDGITYQPDVTLIDQGADAVKAIDPDGLHYTLSKDAGAKAEVGKVLLVTGRVVGRVLDKQDVTDGVQVLLGPVELTDIIQDGTLDFDGPADPSTMRMRSAPTAPADASVDLVPDDPASDDSSSASDQSTSDQSTSDQSTDASTSDAATSSETSLGGVPLGPIEPISHVQATPSGVDVNPGVPLLQSPPLNIGGFTSTSICCAGTIGVHVGYDQNGLRLGLTLQLSINNPTLHFHAQIAKGAVLDAEATLNGAAALKVQLDAATHIGLNGNVHRTIRLPTDISIPVPAPFPASILIQQSFIIDTGFSSKDGSISATGEYTLAGALGMKYSGGGFKAIVPTLSVAQSITNSMDGVAVGVTGMVFGYKIRTMLGIGAFGFAVGPFVDLTASFGITRGSDLTPFLCKGASLDLFVGGGVGYSIPQPIVSAINFVLGKLNLKNIEGTGGPSFNRNVLHKDAIVPPYKVCGGAGVGG